MISLRVYILSVALMGWAPLWATEEEVPTPLSEPDVTTVSAEQLVTLIRSQQSFVLIDARIASGRKKGYIENSFHLADIDTTCATLKEFIPTLSQPAAFYCSSSKCGRSLNAVRVAKACGFSNIYWFRGGFEEWKEKGLPYSIEKS